MKGKLINLKNKIFTCFNNLIKKTKVDKKMYIILIAIIIILVIVIALCTGKNSDNQSHNLNNLGFTLKDGKTIYCLGYNNGKNDGIYKINGKNKEKISEDYGYYLNKYGKYIYYLDTIDNNIVKMKTNGTVKMLVLSAVLPLCGLSTEDFGKRLLDLAAASRRVAEALVQASAEGESSGGDSADPKLQYGRTDFMQV